MEKIGGLFSVLTLVHHQVSVMKRALVKTKNFRVSTYSIRQRDKLKPVHANLRRVLELNLPVSNPHWNKMQSRCCSHGPYDPVALNVIRLRGGVWPHECATFRLGVSVTRTSNHSFWGFTEPHAFFTSLSAMLAAIFHPISEVLKVSVDGRSDVNVSFWTFRCWGFHLATRLRG